MTRPPTPKIILILLLIVVLVAIGFLFLEHKPAPATTTPPVSETTPLPTATQWPSTKVKDETISDKGSYYTISATYPVAKDDVVSGYFKSFVETSISGFKSDTSWAATDDGASAEADSLSLTIKYTEQKTANADNYIFSTDTYTGGAHDLESTKTFSFSPTGQQITLQTVFTNVNAGLKAVQSYVSSKLTSQMADADASMIADGTAPTTDNYQSFTIQPDGITFIFDPYQVAPFSDGMQKVTVPLSVFKAEANTDLF